MCESARGAGTVEKTREELLALGEEHPSYWGPAEVNSRVEPGEPNLRLPVGHKHRTRAFYARYPSVVNAPTWATEWAKTGIYAPPENSTFVELESIAKALARIEAEAKHSLIESYAPRCRSCGARTEPQRWCYTIPTCFACLPAPPSIASEARERQRALK